MAVRPVSLSLTFPDRLEYAHFSTGFMLRGDKRQPLVCHIIFQQRSSTDNKIKMAEG